MVHAVQGESISPLSLCPAKQIVPTPWLKVDRLMSCAARLIQSGKKISGTLLQDKTKQTSGNFACEKGSSLLLAFLVKCATGLNYVEIITDIQVNFLSP